MDKITIVGEQPKPEETEPQTERIVTIYPPGQISEAIPIEGTVPEGEYWSVKVVIQIRKANESEIARYLKEQE